MDDKPLRDKEFGEKLKALIKASGMSRTRLAERMGVSRMAVTSWCNGTNRPTMENALALAGIFEISPAGLLGVTGKEEDISVALALEALKRAQIQIDLAMSALGKKVLR